LDDEPILCIVIYNGSTATFLLLGDCPFRILARTSSILSGVLYGFPKLFLLDKETVPESRPWSRPPPIFAIYCSPSPSIQYCIFWFTESAIK